MVCGCDVGKRVVTLKRVDCKSEGMSRCRMTRRENDMIEERKLTYEGDSV